MKQISVFNWAQTVERDTMLKYKTGQKKNQRLALLFIVLSLPIIFLWASCPASPPSRVPASAWVLATVCALEGLEPEASPQLWSSSRRWSTRSPAFTSNTSSSLEASNVPREFRIGGHARMCHVHVHTQTHTGDIWEARPHRKMATLCEDKSWFSLVFSLEPES